MKKNPLLIFVGVLGTIAAIVAVCYVLTTRQSVQIIQPQAVAIKTDIPMRKLLIVDSQEGNPYDQVRSALLKNLAEQGYVEGKNLEVTMYFIGNDLQEGEKILQSEKDKQYNVIFVGGTVATIAAKNVLLGDKAQNVVFASPTDPVGIGVIKDFDSKPFSNFTGVCYPVPVESRLRFLQKLMPKVKTIGLIYADMPQSISYNKWLTNEIENNPEFKDLKIIFRKVPLITGEDGDATMANLAINHVKELDSQVDVFIKPCDQMGTRKQLSTAVYTTATKPLIGLVRDDVMDHWGATATMYPSHESIGKQAAVMVVSIFEGKNSSDIIPEWPKGFGLAFDMNKTQEFGIDVPTEMLLMAGEDIVK